MAPAPGVRQRQRPAEVQEGAPRPRRLAVAPRQEERDADAGQGPRRGGAGAAGGRRRERLQLPQDGVHAVDGEGGRRRRPDGPTACLVGRLGQQGQGALGGRERARRVAGDVAVELGDAGELPLEHRAVRRGARAAGPPARRRRRRRGEGGLRGRHQGREGVDPPASPRDLGARHQERRPPRDRRRRQQVQPALDFRPRLLQQRPEVALHQRRRPAASPAARRWWTPSSTSPAPAHQAPARACSARSAAGPHRARSWPSSRSRKSWW